MALARRHQVQLVGGDTTRGPLAITVATSGLMPEGQELRRNGARPGDLIYVTGTLGEAGLAMLAQQKEIRLSRQDQEQAQRRLEQPEPRIPMGIAVRGLASAANDLPDGLAAGLGQILEASGTGATLYGERLPVAPGVRPWLATLGLGFPLAAGGDYELCFCVPPARQQAVEASLAGLTPACTWIGIVERAPGLRCLLSDGTDIGPG
jgi:thiamine-monophosphate kinase